jgi:hypothetical protein
MFERKSALRALFFGMLFRVMEYQLLGFVAQRIFIQTNRAGL